MKRWYVVQVYAGYEEAARTDILKRIEKSDSPELFGQVLVPLTRVKPIFMEEAEEQLLFPGYVLIEMEPTPEAIRAITQSARVIRFLGGDDPIPLTAQEAEKMISQVKGEVILAPREDRFMVGGEVEINEGPFTGFIGVVDRVDYENEKLAVMVNILGRMTPVELSFSQIKQ